MRMLEHIDLSMVDESIQIKHYGFANIGIEVKLIIKLVFIDLLDLRLEYDQKDTIDYTKTVDEAWEKLSWVLNDTFTQAKQSYINNISDKIENSKF